jgi:hypothetical protein
MIIIGLVSVSVVGYLSKNKQKTEIEATSTVSKNQVE